MRSHARRALAKVPEVTLLFWITKVLATTLGETGGDAVSMSMNLGYLVSTGIFLVLFAAAVAAQISVERFHPALYWATIVASTTVGTTLADFTDRQLGVGYAVGSAGLLLLLAASLATWHLALGSIAIDTVASPPSEAFYWVTIMCSQTLGTALGDWTADSAGLGYLGGMIVFASVLAATATAYYWTNVSRVALFWIAFILTRPLGAVVGDFLDKPVAQGGLALSRFAATAVLAALIACLVFAAPQRASTRTH